MRIAVITDIHANLPALEAVLAAIEEIGVDELYCGGDLVGYGPHPNQVCALIEERGIPTIYGNHDYAIGRDLEDCGCASITPHDRRLAAQAEAEVLVFGHTHKPWVHEYGGVLFVNCGSVGKPKDGDPRAAFAVLELVGDRIEVSIERVPYDAQAVAREVAAAGLPDEFAEKLVIAAMSEPVPIPVCRFLRDARDTIPAAAPAALIEHEEVLP